MHLFRPASRVLGITLAFNLAGVSMAQLVESNVLLLWNSKDDESTAIKQSYLAAHSGVITFDLNINYANYPPNSIANPACASCITCQCAAGGPPGPDSMCCTCPSIAEGPNQSFKAMDKYYITPLMFEEEVKAPLQAFLAQYAATHPEPQNEPILAIVTTRGLPSIVSESFSAGITHNGNVCVKGSFESHLARVGHSGIVNMLNPYYGRMGIPFKTFINTESTFCEVGGFQHKGKLFLVSRLDSADANQNGSHIDEIQALITRSLYLTVNKFGVTLVFDENVFNPVGAIERDRQVAKYMRDRRWCVYYDESAAFLHGASTSSGTGCGDIDPLIEGTYQQWPELAQITLGRNHWCQGCSEHVCQDYAKWYTPHPAGFFESMESFNGIGLRSPGWPGPNPPNDPGVGNYPQGSVLHWIGAGGSFTYGRVHGAGPFRTQYTIPNLYEHGLSWGEAIWSGIGNMGNAICPIGDPLARVTVYDPDSNQDGIINEVDLLAALNGEIDVDVQLVLDVYGRSAHALPIIPRANPWPMPPAVLKSFCGDVNNDGQIEEGDVEIIEANAGTNCMLLDLNQDGIVDEADYAVAEGNIGKCIGDVNGNGIVNEADAQVLNTFLVSNPNGACSGDSQFDAQLDVNCDGCINMNDVHVLEELLKGGNKSCN